jgi:hypothetical protein
MLFVRLFSVSNDATKLQILFVNKVFITKKMRKNFDSRHHYGTANPWQAWTEVCKLKKTAAAPMGNSGRLFNCR